MRPSPSEAFHLLTRIFFFFFTGFCKILHILLSKKLVCGKKKKVVRGKTEV